MSNGKILFVYWLNEGEYILDIKLNNERPCTISESIKQSCIEVNEMREGKKQKLSLDDLFTKIDKQVSSTI